MSPASLDIGSCPAGERSIIARRRWTSPIGPSDHIPSPSGPLCATAAPIASNVAVATGSPSKRKTPAIPHITRSHFHRAHRYPTVFLTKVRDLESSLCTPTLDLSHRLAMRILRSVPVEVDMNILFKVELLVPEQLGEVPVDQTLNVLSAGLDAKQRNVFFDFDLGLESR